MCGYDFVQAFDTGKHFSDEDLKELVQDYFRMWTIEDICLRQLSCGRYLCMATYFECCERIFCIEWLKATYDTDNDVFLSQPYECKIVTKQFYMPVRDLHDNTKIRERKG